MNQIMFDQSYSYDLISTSLIIIIFFLFEFFYKELPCYLSKYILNISFFIVSFHTPLLQYNFMSKNLYYK